MCAVAVPLLQEEIVLSLLPRDNDGNLLKFSSKLMSPDQAFRFVQDLLDTPSYLSLVLVDAGFDENFKVLNEVREIANRTRSERHERHIAAPNLNYELLVKDAVIGALGLAAERGGSEVTSLEIVLDTANLTEGDQRHFSRVLIENSDEYGFYIRKVTWCRNEDQPLLNTPDIIAGIMHRRFIHNELEESADLFLQAGRDRRIVIQDGRTFVPLPT
jgi:hypothetical protein